MLTELLEGAVEREGSREGVPLEIGVVLEPVAGVASPGGTEVIEV
jgi:hypothetical protein